MGYLIKLVKMARPYWKYLVVSGISMLAITALNLLGPWLVRDLTGIITNISKYPNDKKNDNQHLSYIDSILHFKDCISVFK